MLNPHVKHELLSIVGEKYLHEDNHAREIVRRFYPSQVY